MFEHDESLGLLSRTPVDVPAFHADLDRVARRARIRRARRLSLQGSVGAVIAAGVIGPMLLLLGVIGGGATGRPLDGGGSGQPQKLIRWYEPSGSMDPTIKVGETVLVDTNAYRFGRFPQTGDLILFRLSTEGQEVEMVKRVIGLPGQVVEIHRGVVVVDGRRLYEPYLNRERDPGDFGPYTVAAGALFVLGDNRINSNDSRYSIGPVPMSIVLGKVVGSSPVAGGPPPTALSAPGP